MTKKSWILIFIMCVLAGVYAFYFTDWFKPKIIQITSTNARTGRTNVNANPNAGFLQRLVNLANAGANANASPATVPVIFKLNRPYKLTEIKVVMLDEWQTNKNCLPLWHLIRDTNSAPITRPFAYGQRLRGLKPDVPGSRPRPLQPGVKYRLFVTAGSAKGDHDFVPVAPPPPPPGAANQ